MFFPLVLGNLRVSPSSDNLVPEEDSYIQMKEPESAAFFAVHLCERHSSTSGPISSCQFQPLCCALRTLGSFLLLRQMHIFTGSSSSRVLALKHCLEIRQITRRNRERLHNYIVNIHHLYDVDNKVMEDEVHCSLVGNYSVIQTEGHHLPAE